MTTEIMTKTEREELRRVVRQRAKLAKADVDQAQAERLADIEAQLATRYESNNEAWAEITKEAQKLVAEADAKVAAICKEMGVRQEFRPGLHVSWYDRGENAESKRRTELRKVAQTRLEARARQAKLEVERHSVSVLEKLAAGALESTEAKAFLDAIPTAAELMPAVTLAELEEVNR